MEQSKPVLTPELARLILEDIKQKADAQLLTTSVESPARVHLIEFDLTTEKLETSPFEVGFPWKSAYVIDGSDINAEISLKPITRDTYQKAIPLKLNSTLNFDSQIPRSFLHWEAQSGKSLTILFLVDGSFKTGQIISANGGGVSINDGASFDISKVALTAATATQIVGSDGLRKKVTIQNKTGASVWLGASTVTNSGATEGIELGAGDSATYRNTSALYGYSVAGGDVVIMEEE